MADRDGIERRSGIQRRSSKQFGGRRAADFEDLGVGFEGLSRKDKIAKLREAERVLSAGTLRQHAKKLRAKLEGEEAETRRRA